VVLRLTERVVNQVRAEEAVVKKAMKFLSPRENVELILTAGFYMTTARLTETTRTDPDPSGTKVIDQIRADSRR
jgi:alkylhydroperoxidase family enzyme